MSFDLAPRALRELNGWLHATLRRQLPKVRVLNPDGAHAIACGVDGPFEIDVMGTPATTSPA